MRLDEIETFKQDFFSQIGFKIIILRVRVISAPFCRETLLFSFFTATLQSPPTRQNPLGWTRLLLGEVKL